MTETEKKKDQRIKKEVFPIGLFIGSLAFFAVITTIQMKIIGNYIDYTEIPFIQVIGVFGFWLFAAVLFTFVTGWHIRNKYQEPLERLSEAARNVAEGDFSVYLRPKHTQDKADALDVLTEDFNKMVEELGSIETLKTDFFSNVSHEFKTPLSVIYNHAQLLQKRQDLTAEEREYVGTILDATKRLSNLIQNMLKLNKLEKQTIKPAPELYDVCAQLCECAVQFEDAWEQKEIEFEADISDSAQVLADPGLLELVWNNLLSNAVKFTPQGGKITLKQTSDGEDILVSVEDSGCGMTEDTVKHIFDKFYQADSSHAKNGNGLGLALVKRILELSDASVTVQSEPGRGSVFIVRLPRG